MRNLALLSVAGVPLTGSTRMDFLIGSDYCVAYASVFPDIATCAMTGTDCSAVLPNTSSCSQCFGGLVQYFKTNAANADLVAVCGGEKAKTDACISYVGLSNNFLQISACLSGQKAPVITTGTSSAVPATLEGCTEATFDFAYFAAMVKCGIDKNCPSATVPSDVVCSRCLEAFRFGLRYRLDDLAPACISWGGCMRTMYSLGLVSEFESCTGLRVSGYWPPPDPSCSKAIFDPTSILNTVSCGVSQECGWTAVPSNWSCSTCLSEMLHAVPDHSAVLANPCASVARSVPECLAALKSIGLGDKFEACTGFSLSNPTRAYGCSDIGGIISCFMAAGSSTSACPVDAACAPCAQALFAYIQANKAVLSSECGGDLASSETCLNFLKSSGPITTFATCSSSCDFSRDLISSGSLAEFSQCTALKSMEECTMFIPSACGNMTCWNEYASGISGSATVAASCMNELDSAACLEGVRPHVAQLGACLGFPVAHSGAEGSCLKAEAFAMYISFETKLVDVLNDYLNKQLSVTEAMVGSGACRACYATFQADIDDVVKATPACANLATNQDVCEPALIASGIVEKFNQCVGWHIITPKVVGTTPPPTPDDGRCPITADLFVKAVQDVINNEGKSLSTMQCGSCLASLNLSLRAAHAGHLINVSRCLDGDAAGCIAEFESKEMLSSFSCLKVVVSGPEPTLKCEVTPDILEKIASCTIQGNCEAMELDLSVMQCSSCLTSFQQAVVNEKSKLSACTGMTVAECTSALSSNGLLNLPCLSVSSNSCDHRYQLNTKPILSDMTQCSLGAKSWNYCSNYLLSSCASTCWNAYHDAVISLNAGDACNISGDNCFQALSVPLNNLGACLGYPVVPEPVGGATAKCSRSDAQKLYRLFESETVDIMHDYFNNVRSVNSTVVESPGCSDCYTTALLDIDSVMNSSPNCADLTKTRVACVQTLLGSGILEKFNQCVGWKVLVIHEQGTGGGGGGSNNGSTCSFVEDDVAQVARCSLLGKCVEFNIDVSKKSCSTCFIAFQQKLTSTLGAGLSLSACLADATSFSSSSCFKALSDNYFLGDLKTCLNGAPSTGGTCYVAPDVVAKMANCALNKNCSVSTSSGDTCSTCIQAMQTKVLDLSVSACQTDMGDVCLQALESLGIIDTLNQCTETSSTPTGTSCSYTNTFVGQILRCSLTNTCSMDFAQMPCANCLSSFIQAVTLSAGSATWPCQGSDDQKCIDSLRATTPFVFDLETCLDKPLEVCSNQDVFRKDYVNRVVQCAGSTECLQSVGGPCLLTNVCWNSFVGTLGALPGVDVCNNAGIFGSAECLSLAKPAIDTLGSCLGVGLLLPVKLPNVLGSNFCSIKEAMLIYGAFQTGLNPVADVLSGKVSLTTSMVSSPCQNCYVTALGDIVGFLQSRSDICAGWTGQSESDACAISLMNTSGIPEKLNQCIGYSVVVKSAQEGSSTTSTTSAPSTSTCPLLDAGVELKTCVMTEGKSFGDCADKFLNPASMCSNTCLSQYKSNLIQLRSDPDCMGGCRTKLYSLVADLMNCSGCTVSSGLVDPETFFASGLTTSCSDCILQFKTGVASLTACQTGGPMECLTGIVSNKMDSTLNLCMGYKVLDVAGTMGGQIDLGTSSTTTTTTSAPTTFTTSTRNPSCAYSNSLIAQLATCSITNSCTIDVSTMSCGGCLSSFSKNVGSAGRSAPGCLEGDETKCILDLRSSTQLITELETCLGGPLDSCYIGDLFRHEYIADVVQCRGSPDCLQTVGGSCMVTNSCWQSFLAKVQALPNMMASVCSSGIYDSADCLALVKPEIEKLGACLGIAVPLLPSKLNDTGRCSFRNATIVYGAFQTGLNAGKDLAYKKISLTAANVGFSCQSCYGTLMTDLETFIPLHANICSQWRGSSMDDCGKAVFASGIYEKFNQCTGYGILTSIEPRNLSTVYFQCPATNLATQFTSCIASNSLASCASSVFDPAALCANTCLSQYKSSLLTLRDSPQCISASGCPALVSPIVTDLGACTGCASISGIVNPAAYIVGGSTKSCSSCIVDLQAGLASLPECAIGSIECLRSIAANRLDTKFNGCMAYKALDLGSYLPTTTTTTTSSTTATVPVTSTSTTSTTRTTTTTKTSTRTTPKPSTTTATTRPTTSTTTTRPSTSTNNSTRSTTPKPTTTTTTTKTTQTATTATPTTTTTRKTATATTTRPPTSSTRTTKPSTSTTTTTTRTAMTATATMTTTATTTTPKPATTRTTTSTITRTTPTTTTTTATTTTPKPTTTTTTRPPTTSTTTTKTTTKPTTPTTKTTTNPTTTNPPTTKPTTTKPTSTNPPTTKPSTTKPTTTKPTTTKPTSTNPATTNPPTTKATTTKPTSTNPPTTNPPTTKPSTTKPTTTEPTTTKPTTTKSTTTSTKTTTTTKSTTTKATTTRASR